MKIAMVGQFPPHVGGVGVHIHTLSKKLVDEGHEVYVITYPHRNIEDIDGIHVIGTKGLNLPGVRGLMFKMNAKKALEDLLEKEDIDIIHGHYLFPAGAAAVEVGREHNIKTYVTAHGSDMFELYKKQPFMRSPIKKVLRDADGVFAVSNALRHEIIATGVTGIANKTKLSWNSVDINKFSSKTNDLFKKENKLEDKPIVLFVGNLIKRKNVDSLLDAKKVSQSEYYLVIVGDGPQFKKLNKKVEEENIHDVIFTGSRNDVENIIPSCDVLILPSFSESFGLVLIEALACGKPVIGSDVGGITEIINDDVGLLVNPNKISSIAKAIDTIIQDDDLRLVFSLNARNRAFDFSEVTIPYDEVN
ncbi:N-acetyl-alpha-D-glucosaminyl L-malate synthase BshA [Methanobrevibacter gottschalkii]|uniref:N-acetyl-alpha-D-glucosaminyl L-malate synthase BshA n=2 Tax=Methanobrevibacter gottschalkii TaxID=190974 RepID=A0A3N5B390_9EURY|nr:MULTISPECIES: glycosyltransferase family 4 protein [Methanobrevibacter]OEC96830.1 glycosyl transferase family 1 [Methanobrevibacter sp. A27]RPF51549.1 N-acetyl-alpha-D-glucosaminyl L-malate synthase BshA [Methanobrevibacter gottschalkii DSM 11977]SEK71792.1 N-acetyl-alpha-D-glucosaminyl L-malate synthase BshA [Methanobrevibacter gottschalkii]